MQAVISLCDRTGNFVAPCRTHARWSGAPYCIEHPVTMLVSIPHIGKPDHYFHPWEYAGWLDDIQEDNTSKKTCLWTGNGFVMPPKRPAPEPHREDVWKATPSDDRADIRSATPPGFSKAVFLANRPRSANPEFHGKHAAC